MPWTEICISRGTGQRISGPLFFGFSDATLQMAIASMDSEDEWREAAEGRSSDGSCRG